MFNESIYCKSMLYCKSTFLEFTRIDYDDEQIKRNLYFRSWVHDDDTIDNIKELSVLAMHAAHHYRPDGPVSHPAYNNQLFISISMVHAMFAALVVKYRATKYHTSLPAASTRSWLSLIKILHFLTSISWEFSARI